MAATGLPTDDPRLRHIIQVVEDHSQIPEHRTKPAIAIVGFPFDEGCVRNGGRAGASEGPQVFRTHLYKIGCTPNPETQIDIGANIDIYDCGDVQPGETLEDTFEALRTKVQDLISRGLIPFVIGGSNDQSYSNACALINESVGQSIFVVNIDAHLDVRPQKNGKEHSGSPFRQLLEHERFQQPDSYFLEFAAQGHQCSAQHADFVLNRELANTDIVWWTKDLRGHQADQIFAELLEKKAAESIFVSFDVDSIRAADCPGVSCPSPVGLTAPEALGICRIAGRTPTVKLLDCSEFNPQSESYNTGKLISAMFYYFAMGVAERS